MPHAAPETCSGPFPLESRPLNKPFLQWDDNEKDASTGTVIRGMHFTTLHCCLHHCRVNPSSGEVSGFTGIAHSVNWEEEQPSFSAGRSHPSLEAVWAEKHGSLPTPYGPICVSVRTSGCLLWLCRCLWWIFSVWVILSLLLLMKASWSSSDAPSPPHKPFLSTPQIPLCWLRPSNLFQLSDNLLTVTVELS